MSTFYKEKNNESTFELFNKRVVYFGDSSSDTYTNLIDFTAEKIMYGRVSRTFAPIVIPQGSSRLKQIPSETLTSQGLQALDFVVDAFLDLQQQFLKCSIANKINNSDEYLTNLKVYKAYVDPYNRYEQYMRRYRPILQQDSRMNSTNMENFDIMANGLSEIVGSAGQTNPFTFPAFVKSRKAPINISGLAIEIADLDAANDDEKINSFINSPNWNFYLNTCRTYGFMVDQNVPWRLVADIASEPMLEYARNYNLNSVDEILTFTYQSAYYSYYQNFTQILLDMYNQFKPRSIIKINECNSRVNVTRVRPREYANTDILTMNYNQSKLINLYCNIRFDEEETQYTDNQKFKLIKDTLQISKSRSAGVAIELFEREINKTFDYQGSLGYYIQKSEVREQEEIFGEPEVATMSTNTTTQTTGY